MESNNWGSVFREFLKSFCQDNFFIAHHSPPDIYKNCLERIFNLFLSKNLGWAESSRSLAPLLKAKAMGNTFSGGFAKSGNLQTNLTERKKQKQNDFPESNSMRSFMTGS